MAWADDRVEMSFYSMEGNQLLYRGQRSVKTGTGTVTETTTFTTPAGKPIQKILSVFQSAGLVPVRYELNDLRSGQQEALIKRGRQMVLSAIEKKGEDLDTDTVDWEPGMLYSTTVVPTIQREWARLARGETVPFVLLVPSRQDDFSFRVQKDEELTAREKSRTVIRMEPDSWIVRRLVDPMYFYFESKPPYHLLEYRGRVTIKTDKGKTQDLRVTYHYLKEGG